MKIKIFLIFLFILAFFSLGFLTLGTRYFVVKKIILPKNVRMKKEALLKYMQFNMPKRIWLYNTDSMRIKLAKLPYLKNCRVKKIYPDTIKFAFEIRSAVVLVRGKSAKLYQVDDSGVIFAGLSKTGKRLPLIFYQKSDDLSIGSVIKGDEYHIIEVLSELQKSDKLIYDSISQIKVVNSMGIIDYSINYMNDTKNIIIKNKINDEILIKGAVCSLFLTDNDTVGNLLFTDIGFIF